MSFFNSIKFKFTLWYLSILGTVLVVLGIGIYLSLSTSLQHNMDHSLKVRAEQITQLRDVIAIIAGGTFEEEPGELLSIYYYSNDQVMDVSPKGRKIPVDTIWINRILDGESGFANISTKKEGSLRVYSMVHIPVDSHIRLDKFTAGHKTGPRQENERESAPGDRTHLQNSRPKPDRRPPPPWNERDRPQGEERHGSIVEIDRAVLIVARSTKDMDIALSRLLQILVMALPITLLLIGCCGIFLLRIILNPVKEIADTAREIEGNDLGRRIDVTTKDELGRLASTLNMMIARLEKAFLRQKELTGDASHELRAPLAVIQAEATLALQRERDLSSYQKSLEIIAQESGHMSGIIKQLLSLARADSGKEQVNFERLDLAPFIQALCDDVDILCREKGQTLILNHNGPIYIRGDKNLLRNLMLNLLRNAMQYTAEGGDIEVILDQKNRMAVIAVADTGIGIPPEALAHIFKRFYRVDTSRSRESGGSGLGLAICKHIVELHQGTLHVNSQINRGSTFVIRIPLSMQQ